MNVLSLFDGMSCGRIALEKSGIKVTNYLACEIDKYAVSISKKNYPDIYQLGDVTKVSLEPAHGYHGIRVNHVDEDGDNEFFIMPDAIDLLIGGSPCQSFSIAGDGSGFDGSSKLFWEYIRLLKEARAANPNLKFLLENVKMKKEWRDIISEAVGVEPIEFNSKIVSAQNRPRLYWTNIEGFELPDDRGIILSDILQDDVAEKYYLSDKAISYMDRERQPGKPRWEFHKNDIEGKAACLTANMFKGVPYGVLRLDRCNQVATLDMKGNDAIRRVYDESGKSPCLTTSTGGHRQPKVLDREREIARKLTPLECERLQTVPDGYTEGVSDTQRYKMLGNGWTVDVIVEFFKLL
jgi:DNA (cytosine-5)-methyltransferase 3A